MLLRWELQRGVSTAFKAVDPKHIQSNLEAVDFELPQDDMRALTTIAYTVSSTATHALQSNASHSWRPGVAADAYQASSVHAA